MPQWYSAHLLLFFVIAFCINMIWFIRLSCEIPFRSSSLYKRQAFVKGMMANGICSSDLDNKTKQN